MQESRKRRKFFWPFLSALLTGTLLSTVSFCALLTSARVGSTENSTVTLARWGFVSGLLLALVSLSSLILMAYHSGGRGKNEGP